MLTAPFSVPYSEVWVSDLTVKVVLPEWARDIKLHVPFDVEEVRGVPCGGGPTGLIDVVGRCTGTVSCWTPPPSHDMVNE